MSERPGKDQHADWKEHHREERQEFVLASGKAGIEALVAPRVVAKMASHGTRILRSIVAGDKGAAVGREQERRQN